MRRLADEIEAEEKGEHSRAQEERIAKLEEQLKRADPSPRELEDALEEITDEELELIRQHRAGKIATPAPEPVVETPPAVERKTRPGRKAGNAYGWYVDDDGRVVKSDIPQVYNGEDEPDEVELPEEAAAA